MFRTTKRPWFAAACAASLFLTGSGIAAAQDVEADRLASRPGWSKGPHTGDLGDQATVSVPEGYYFLNASATRAFLQATENVPSGRELGAVVHVLDEKHSWFALFSFSDDGYVDDSDKDKIDADALMKNMKAGTEQDNEERKKRGWAPFTLEGWQEPPYYDATTHNLTWAIRGSSPGESATINHSVRLLGRRGVMSVALVAGQDTIDAATSDFNQLLTGFEYKSGQRYAEFRSGDKLAGYGLAALIGGGAAAAAVKTGFLSKAWKAIAGLIAAAAAGLKKLFGRKEPESVATVQPPPVPPGA
jgi:uncharacterized membrane-anchored protein